MRLVLLQRLTGYDKRTPNGKSFLGMRGKKMGAITDPLTKLQHEEEQQEDYSSQLKSSDEADDESNYYTVPDKKKEKFLGMRGKKEYGTLTDNNNYLMLRQLQQMAESKKRVPSSNAFMGVRGKRSAAAGDIN
jgi:hypothetical protein